MRFRKFIDVDSASIERVRQRAVQAYKSDPELFDQNDITKLIESDWTAFRFLVPVNCDEDAAVDKLISSLKWRKEKNLRNFDLSKIPDVFFRIGTIFRYEPDRWGHRTIYVRVKLLRKVPELRPTMQDICDYILWTTDEASGDSGWILILDFEGAGLQNAEFDVLRGMIDSLKTNFPCGLDFILVVDLPWILKAFWGVVKSWIDTKQENLIRFVSRKNITEYFEPKCLPDFMMGTAESPYCGPNHVKSMGIVSSPSLYSFCQETLQLPDERCSAIDKIFKPKTV